MVIRPEDRVSSVLARDESLVDVFVDASPAFERLRKPALRRVMSRLVTVAQAARIAGVDADDLVRRLNHHLGEDAGPAPSPGTGASGVAERTPRPPALEGLPPERILDLDVREDLRTGREPFSRIMGALRELPEDGVLRLRAVFEPVPLYGVLEKRGFHHWTERLAPDDWRVWFHQPVGTDREAASSEGPRGVPGEPGDRETVSGPSPDASAGAEPGEPPGAAPGPDPDVVVLDVRGLEPPEPMVRTLEALETLPPGGTLVQLNVRVPRFLLPRLKERGFTWEIREQDGGPVRVFIRRGGGP